MTTRREIDELAAATGFSGVVRIDRGGEIELEAAYGLADRAHDVRNTIDTQFAVASATKGLTALAIVSLVVDGVLELSMPARSWLGDDLPLIDDAVTIEHLLAHRSGIGDYPDEEDGNWGENDYVMAGPIHEYTTTEHFLTDLDGHHTKFPPGQRFSYCNGGYMVLALIAQRASDTPFHHLVRDHVCAPAGPVDTDYLRSDELPDRTAYGYLSIDGVSRTNVFHLPILGNGDGGIYTTAADVSTFWRAFYDATIVPAAWVAEMVRPRSNVPEESMRFGLGFWLHPSTETAILLGGDAGVSFRSTHDPTTRLTQTVISNTSQGAWPIIRRLDELLRT